MGWRPSTDSFPDSLLGNALTGEPQLSRKCSNLSELDDDENIDEVREALERWACSIAARFDASIDTHEQASSEASCATRKPTWDAARSEASEVTRKPCQSRVCLQGSLSVNCRGLGPHLCDLHRACESALLDTLSHTMVQEISVRVSCAPGPGGTSFGRAFGLLAFGFTVVSSDPHDVDVLHESLLQESSCAGALHLLPSLVSHLSLVGELAASHLQVSLNVQKLSKVCRG